MRYQFEVQPGAEVTIGAETDYTLGEIARELGRRLTIAEDIAVRRLIEDHAMRLAQLGALELTRESDDE